MASHGVLDVFTDGGMGEVLLWPWSNERFLAPVRMIGAASLSISRFLSARGASVLLSELAWCGCRFWEERWHVECHYQ